MAYNKALDKELFSAVIGADELESEGLKVGVYAYNGGEPKVQIGPRFYTKKNGVVGFRKAGRMSAEELVEFCDLAGEIAEVIDSNQPE